MSDRLLPDTSRRSFLRGALTLAVAATVVRPTDLLANAPWIRGDGVHDDTAGLQALLDGQPFRCDLPGVGWRSASGTVEISGGRYVLSQPLVANRPVRLIGGFIDAVNVDGPFLRINAAGSHIQNCVIRSAAWWRPASE